jgi:hypothetical protein
MTRRTVIAATALVVSSAFAANAQQRVFVVGCPTTGVVAKCLVLRGPDNVTYNITDARQRPEIGQRAIQVTGIRSNRLSPCQQGVVLKNVAWTYTDQKCGSR